MISIVIPVYNVASYIEQSLLSAFNQTYSDVEYILVDDCGKDNSFIIIEQLMNKTIFRDKRIRIVRHKCNRGLSAARNTGIEYAEGEYIFFMDSDDEITSDCLALHLDCINRTNADFTIGGIRLEGGRSIHIKSISSELERLSPLQTYLQRKWLGSACNKLYRTDFLRDNNLKFKEGLLHEDLLWSFRILQKTKQIGVVQDETYMYKIRSNSITTQKNSSKKIESMLYILREMDETWHSGVIPYSLEADYVRFYDFTRLNTALLLLNFDGDFETANQYYRSLVQLGNGRWNTTYALTLKLSFRIFNGIVGPLYRWYKRK